MEVCTTASDVLDGNVRANRRIDDAMDAKVVCPAWQGRAECDGCGGGRKNIGRWKVLAMSIHAGDGENEYLRTKNIHNRITRSRCRSLHQLDSGDSGRKCERQTDAIRLDDVPRQTQVPELVEAGVIQTRRTDQAEVLNSIWDRLPGSNLGKQSESTEESTGCACRQEHQYRVAR
jgi:hypothetical protein